MDPISLITLLIFGGIVALVASYFVARYLKGNLKINLEKNTYSSGEKIVGRVELKAKKEIKAKRFFVSLIAEKKEYEKSNKNQETWRKIYEHEELLEGARDYTVGFMQIYKFEISVPNKTEIDGKIQNSELNALINLSKIISKGNVLRWRVQVTLDAKGVDLVSEQKIEVKLI